MCVRDTGHAQDAYAASRQAVIACTLHKRAHAFLSAQDTQGGDSDVASPGLERLAVVDLAPKALHSLNFWVAEAVLVDARNKGSRGLRRRLTLAGSLRGVFCLRAHMCFVC